MTEPGASLSFSQVRQNLKHDYSRFPTVRLAILSDSPTQFLHEALRGWAFTQAVNPVTYEARGEAPALEIADSASGLYAFEPTFILVFESTQTLLSRFYAARPEDKTSFAAAHVAHVESLCHTLSARLDCTVIYCNFPEIDDRVYGQYANKTPGSFPHQLRKINVDLMDLAARTPNLFVADLSSLQNTMGRSRIVSNAMHTSVGLAFHLDFWPHVAKSVLDIVQALRGRVHKAVILDLDNTLWGGVVGDDGLERLEIGGLGAGQAFTQLQRWLKQLEARGIVLAVCSKNDERLAKDVFERHPEMVLRLDDIAVFMANWENKVDNIRHIQTILNIGFDAMVYLDDSPFERAMVRDAIPSLTVPELPADPADYLDALYSLNLFETAAASAADDSRTQQYQQEARRAQLRRTYASEDEFLASLGMVSCVAPFDSYHVPRIAQLSQRSNQFNLRTVRYTERDVERLTTDPGHLTLCFTLRDRLGDYGLVSVVILERRPEHLFIENWMMSCRVLKRGLESFALHHIVRLAAENGYRTLVGEFVPSGRNELVRDHYSRLGFVPREERWALDTEGFASRHVHIASELPATPPPSATRMHS